MSRRPRRAPNPAGKSRAAAQPLAASWQAGIENLPGHLPALLLAALACLAYANAWPNTLVYDDQYFVVAERFADPGWSGLLQFFFEDIWAGYGADSGLYRPLYACVIAIEWLLFGDWAAGYHLFNILLHSGVSVLVYRWLRRLLPTDSGDSSSTGTIAFLAGAVFAVHPIHAEVVNSVFNGSELWASLGVVGGLLWLLQHIDHRPLRAWGGLGLIYLGALLTRETAAVLPALAVLTAWITGAGNWRGRLVRATPALWLVLPFAIYVALRIGALGGLGGAAGAPGAAAEGLLEQVLDDRVDKVFGAHRLLPALQTWYFALRLFLWPAPLSLQHLVAEVPAWLAVGSQALIAAAAIYLAVRRRPLLPFALAFFYLTILPVIIFMGRNHAVVNVQERYVYLPSVGLALVLALCLRELWRRFGPPAPLLAASLIVLALTPMSWQRNADWSDNLVLFESEYQAGRTGSMLLANLAFAYATEGDLASAARVCDTEAGRFGQPNRFTRTCGQVYGALIRTADAERMLLPATERGRERQMAHKTLADLYARLGRREEARTHYERAIEKEPQPAMKALRKAQMLHGLYPDDPGRRREALRQIERALELQPRLVQAQQLKEKLLAE